MTIATGTYLIAAICIVVDSAKKKIEYGSRIKHTITVQNKMATYEEWKEAGGDKGVLVECLLAVDQRYLCCIEL